MIKTTKDTIEGKQWSFHLGNKTIVIRDVCDRVIDALVAGKEVGAAQAGLNPYASLAWTGLQWCVERFQTAKEVRALCWDGTGYHD